MVNKVNRDAFNRFKKLKPKNRMRVANTPVGQSMLSLLTPSQFADLFPKQYRSGYLPDVGGFNLAISRKSQKAQQEYFDGLDRKLGTTSPGAAERTAREGATRTTPGGQTTPSSTPFAGSQRDYYNQIYNEVLKAAKEQGVSNPEAIARLGAAQSSQETGYGKHVPGNNHFGIKGPGRSYTSDEVINGQRKSVTSSFRQYNSMKDSARDYVKFLRENKRYKPVLDAKTPEEAIEAQSKSGYATDPNYGNSLKNIHSKGIKDTTTSQREVRDRPTTPSSQVPSKSGLNITDVSGSANFGMPTLKKRDGFIIHHTGGGGNVTGVMETFKQRGLPVHYVIDRDGNVFRTLPQGSQGRHIRDSYGKYGTEKGSKLGLDNTNTEGVEIIAKDDKDVTPAQQKAAAQLAAKLGYGKDQIYGHGEINKHKQSTEGSTVVDAIRGGQMDEYFTKGSSSEQVPDPKVTYQGPKQDEKLSYTGDKSFLTMADPTGEHLQKFKEWKKEQEVLESKGEVKVAPVSSAPTADVLKPSAYKFNFSEAEFESAVRGKYGFLAAGYDRAGLVKEFKDKLPPGIKYDKGVLEVDPKAMDSFNSAKKELVDQFGADAVNRVVTPHKEKRTEAETPKQTAFIDRVKKEFSGTAQAQEAGDAFAREAEYRKLHVYGPEMPTDKPTQKAGVDPVKMRQKIEGYYGQKINDHEYDMLIRATHGESSAKKHNPQEQAMIMGTILNRAKSHKGGIEGALMARSQFESVTGRTKGKFSPNPAYKAGPSARRMESMYEATMQHLHNVPSNQKYFTSEYGDKTGWHKKMVAMGGDVHAGTRFGTKLGQGPAPDVAAVSEAPPPGATPLPPVQDASLGQRIAKELSPVTPAQAATPPAPAPATTSPMPTPASTAPEFPKATQQGVPTPPTRPTAFVAPPEPVKPPDESSTQNFLRTQGIPAQPVPGASDGGAFDLAISPLDKRDDHAVINTRTQQPLFTVKSGERINVTPQQKVDGNMGPSGPDYGKEMDALRHELSSSMASAGDPPKVQMRQVQQQKSDDPNFGERLLKANKNKPYSNPAFERAMNRTRMQETGDTLNGHFSAGNTNY